MSHYAYVIADTEEAADEKVRRYILSSTGDRRIMESWDMCFKGEHDALALLAKHKPDEPDAKLWRVALALIPVDVPRETLTGGHEHQYTATRAAWPSGPGEHDVLKVCDCGAQIIIGEIPDVP